MGRWKTLRKETTKNHGDPGLLHVFHVRVFAFSAGEQWAGFWWCLCRNPIGVSEGWSPLWGCSFLCWVHSEIFLHDIQVRLLHTEGPLPGRFCQVGWADLGPQTLRFSSQPPRRRPSQLTMALFPSGSHLVCGRILWAWRREGPSRHRATVGRVGVRNGGFASEVKKCLVFLDARDVIDHGIQNVFCTVQVYGKRLYAEKSQSKLCIKYKSSFMKTADTHKVLSS